MAGTSLVLRYADNQILLDLMRATRGEYIQGADYDTNTITPGTYQNPTNGSGTVQLTALQTNPDTGFRLYGFALEVNDYVPYGNLPPLSGGTGIYGLTVWPSYTQPKPPATDTTTAASTTGNLALINRWWAMNFMQAFNADSTSSGTGVTMTANQQKQGVTVVFKEPPMIVGSNLAMTWASPSWDNGNAFNFRFDVIGKYVPITSAQYVNAIAIATGQAVLPPTIFN